MFFNGRYNPHICIRLTVIFIKGGSDSESTSSASLQLTDSLGLRSPFSYQSQTQINKQPNARKQAAYLASTERTSP